MKDKQAKRISIKDHIDNLTPAAPEGTEKIKESSDSEVPVSFFAFDEEFEAKLDSYNSNLLDLDKDFSSLVPLNRILVRVYAKTLKKNDEGLILPNVEMVPIRTQSGRGNVGFVESPYPYSRKAVVVAVPEGYKERLSPKQVILLNSNPVKPISLGQGDDFLISIPNGFTHPDFYEGNEPPRDPEDKNYGYLLVFPNDVDFIVPKTRVKRIKK